jgi:hypothetical protein
MRSCDAITIAKAWEKNSTLTLIDISNNDVWWSKSDSRSRKNKYNTNNI